MLRATMAAARAAMSPAGIGLDRDHCGNVSGVVVKFGLVLV